MKFIPCRSCHSSRVPGYLSKTDSDGFEVLVECKCHRAWRAEQTLAIKIKTSGLSEQDRSFEIDQYLGNKSKHELKKLERYVESFKDFSREVLYFYGPNGTQKTTLSKWVGIRLLEKGFSVQYALMQTLIKNLMIFDEEERRDTCQKYYDCDMLIVDEVFDRTKITMFKSGYQIPFLDQFIRDRLDVYKKGMILISNKKVEEIDSEGFGYSLQDLIQRKVILKKSLLYFEDRYFDEVNKSNLKGIFD